MVGRDFGCLAQRVIYSYMCTYPDFIPLDNETVTVDEQREMNSFLRSLIYHIYNNPDFIVTASEPDQFFENGVMNKINPVLVTKMKAIDKKLTAFYRFLYDMGEIAELGDGCFVIDKEKLKITNDKIKKLREIGFEAVSKGSLITLTSQKYPRCFPAWKLLFELCDEKKDMAAKEMLWFRFMHGIFNEEAISELNIFGQLFETPLYLEKLEKYLLDLGYRYAYKDNRLRLIKEYPKNQLGYIAIEFAYRRRYQMSIEFHIPNFTKLLNSYSDMSPCLQGFIFDRLKDCDDCGYCTQTDKSGKRKPVHLTLERGGKASLKCPLYPRFGFGEITEEISDNMIQIFALADTGVE